MNPTLSTKLKRYYVRDNNKIIFANGMNLSELATAMWENLGYREVDASVISRVLQGERLFSFLQLKTFCRILNIPKEEVNELLDSLYEDLSFKFGIAENFYERETRHLLDLVSDSINKIYVIKEKGYPGIAIDWINQLEEKIEIGINKTTAPIVRKRLREFQIKLLIEKIFCIYESDDFNSPVQRVFQITKKLEDINLELGQNEIDGIIKFSKGGILYVKKDYKNAIPYLETSINTPLPNEIRAQALRQLIYSYSKVKKASLVKEISDKLKKESAGLNDDFNFQIKEGVSRSWSEIGNEIESFYALEDSKKILENINKIEGSYKELRRIQIIRTELEISLKKEKKNNKTTYLQRIANEGAILSKKHGYLRHKDTIEALSKKLQ